MNKVFFVIMAAAIMFSSCIQDGGPQGPTGNTGPMGPPGRDGKDGTQISTHYFEVYPEQWSTAGRSGSAGYYCFADIRFNALTSLVIDDGAVLVYFISEVADQEYDNLLPYITHFKIGGTSYTRVIRYDLQVGKLSLIVEDSDFNTPLPPFGGTVQIKVVVISKI